MRVRRAILPIILIAILTLSGCQRRDLDMEYIDNAELTVIFDWTKSKLNPNGATILFYPSDGSAPIEKLTHSDTTTISLKVGFYSIIAFNETTIDFDNIAFRNTDRFETIEAYVKEEGSNKADDIISANPDILASATIGEFEVTKDMVLETRTRTRTKTKSPLSPNLTLTLLPKRVVYPAVVTAKVQGMNNIASAGAYVTGFTESIFLGSNRTSIYSTTQKFTFTEQNYDDGSKKNGTLRGSFNCFGLREDLDNASITGYSLTFRSLLHNGEYYQQQFNIEKNMVTVNIEIGIQFNIEIGMTSQQGGNDDPIIIPDVDIGGGGWDINIGEWEDIVVPIDI